MKTGISSQQISYFERIKSLQLSTPQLIGFGISDRESYLTASKYANGVIIGSAFIKHLKDKNEVDKATSDFINLILKP